MYIYRGTTTTTIYDGRRYTAHSGADSDDALLYFGYLSDFNDIILSFNYERHGITESVEISLEEVVKYIDDIRLDVTKKYV